MFITTKDALSPASAGLIFLIHKSAGQQWASGSGPNDKVPVRDTLAASGGLVFLVYKLAQHPQGHVR